MLDIHFIKKSLIKTSKQTNRKKKTKTHEQPIGKKDLELDSDHIKKYI